MSSHDIAEKLDIDHMSILYILHEDLELRNVWILYQLTPEKKQLCINCAKHIQHSLLHADW